MKNIYLLVFTIAMTSILFSTSACSDSDDECSQSDWIGTYRLQPDTENCSSASISLSSTVIITAGSNDDQIIFEGTQISFNGCKFTDDSILPLSVELKGNELFIEGFGCTGTYTK